MKNLHNQTKQSGISLVEILVALVISLFLLGGIVQVYVGNKTTFAFTNALAEVQENGRFAVDMISQDLRLAGEWGCINFDPSDTSNVNNTLSGATVPTYLQSRFARLPQRGRYRRH
jgi:type IV pilus assembly protein PilW